MTSARDTVPIPIKRDELWVHGINKPKQINRKQKKNERSFDLTSHI